MSISDPMEVLLASDRWASGNILDACVKLSPEEFTKPFEIGRGSLQASTLHIIGAMRGWSDALRGNEYRPRLEETLKNPTAAELLPLLEEVAAEFAALVHAGKPDETITRERGGKNYTFMRGAVAAHVMTHGFHTRAQCLNMLRHLGVKPLPMSSVLEWMLAMNPPK